MTGPLLGLAVAVPLAVALLAAVRPLRPLTGWLAGAAAIPALLLALLGVPGTSLDLPWLFLGTRLGLDATGQVFLFLTALLWGLAGLYARPYLRGGHGWFFVPWLAAFAGNVGLVLAEDVLSFYLFFALMGFASYPLIVHDGHRKARRAGAVYLALVVLGEMALFAGVALATAGVENALLADLRVAGGAAPWLVLVGLGVKAGALPVHVWLPLAHPEAPTPASAVLSGAMIKAGLLGWVRMLPLGEVALPAQGTVLVVLGLLAAFYGVVVGLAQRDPKALLAYSSVSQMGLMTLVVGLGLLDPGGWRAVVVALFALHHGLAKGALFLGVGVARGAWSGWRRALVAVGLLLPALAVAGAPWTSGAVAKASLKAVVKVAPGAWADLLPLLIALSGVATSVLMGRFLWLCWPRARGEPVGAGLAVPWGLLLAALASVLWLLPWEELRGTVWEATHVVPSWDDLWPLGAGVLIVGAAIAAARRGRAFPLRVPPGDLLIPVLAVLLPAGRWIRGMSGATGMAWESGVEWVGMLAVRLARAVGEGIGAVEGAARRWRVMGTLLLLLALAVGMLVG